jgi:para-nitrobenzyl esterase
MPRARRAARVRNLDRGQPAVLIGTPPSAEAELLSAQMRTAWRDFAATGDPGWPAYDVDRRLARCFDAESTVAPYAEERSRQIWQGYPFSALGLM